MNDKLEEIVNLKKERLRYLLAPVITLVLYSVILAVKGIYPFGNNTIDYYDMAQQIAAFYYHVYDALHGTKGFFYDWYTALGVNMAMSTSGCSNLSLFNLFFLFIRRSSLLKSLSVFNGLKLMCMSAAMYFYLHKTHPKSPEFFKVVSSVGYSFCGFVLVLYITNQWIDIAVLFPLIMYFYDKMLKTGRMMGYVITLAITLIASYYLGFMILIFIFLYTGLILIGEKLIISGKDAHSDIIKNTGIHIAELGYGTMLGIALSSFILVPQLIQMLGSARFKNGNGSESTGLVGKYLEILSHVRGDYTTRWWSLLGLSFAAAVILTGILRCIGGKRIRENDGIKVDSKAEHNETGVMLEDILSNRPILTTVLLILIMVLELFFESINLIWHFGSYVQYPIRNGFIIYFVFAYLTCFFAGRIYDEECERSDRSYLSFIFTVTGFLLFIAFYRNHPYMPIRKVFHLTSGMMGVAFLFYFSLLNFETLRTFVHARRNKQKKEDIRESEEKRSKAGYKWAAGFLAFEVLCYGFLLFGKPEFITGYTEEPEQNGEYVYICEQLRDKFDLGPEFLHRMKNPDESLNANYGLVLMQPVLSNWTHLIAPGEQAGAANWGYSIQFTRLLDSGGTVFSDALIGIRRVISRVPIDERLYEAVDNAEVVVDHLSGQTAEYTLYNTKYSLPFGVVLNGRDELIQRLNTADTVDLHNTIYETMARPDKAGDKTDELAFWLIKGGSVKDGKTKVDEETTGSMRIVNIETKIKGESALYLLGSGGDREYANCTIEVLDTDQGRFMTIPTIGEYDNIYYPAHFNNNAVYLGCFENKTVRLRVTMDIDKGEGFEVDLMGIHMEAMDGLCRDDLEERDDNVAAGNRTLTLSVDSDDSSTLLLPLTYDKGWKITLNGRKVKASSCAGLFTAIPLEKGKNDLKMSFTPPGMAAGTVITLIAIAITLVFIVLVKLDSEMMMLRTERVFAEISKVLAPIYICIFAISILFMYIIPIIYGAYVLFAVSG
ncbi:MAG: YfhO family protein [Lachnospiraceae bacterium]|nr:YfhO family protein [Lachnospiraceae bacterium]